ncbi:hypothetical protein OHT52_04735 [Streptomyces sp. NBC_00247]|uniref:hypothetical protein n=1 Tax=Streptomyces sp. NBC_00247 TaxID=2975689 RepID=UPI002E28CB61|nr:hypothetical protein [Streptomyces sp. NBC_00247]
MAESWVVEDGGAAHASSEAVLKSLRARVGRGLLETWLTSSAGRSLAFVTNTERAMVMLLGEDGDPGEHAADPGAEGTSTGFVLSTGQHDAYPDRDTVPIGEALRLVEHIVSTGSWPAGVHGVVDR